MRIKEIKLLEELLGINRSKVANEIGVSKGDLSATLNGKRRNPAIREKYVDLLRARITTEQVFDEDFEAVVAKNKTKAA